MRGAWQGACGRGSGSSPAQPPSGGLGLSEGSASGPRPGPGFEHLPARTPAVSWRLGVHGMGRPVPRCVLTRLSPCVSVS